MPTSPVVEGNGSAGAPITAQHRFVAGDDTAVRMSWVYVGTALRVPQVWLVFFSYWLILTVTLSLVVRRAPLLGTMALATLAFVAVLVSWVWSTWRRARRHFEDHARARSVLMSGFGDEAFIVWDATGSKRQTYRSVKDVVVWSDFVALLPQGKPKPMIVPRVLFPADAVDRVRGTGVATPALTPVATGPRGVGRPVPPHVMRVIVRAHGLGWQTPLGKWATVLKCRIYVFDDQWVVMPGNFVSASRVQQLDDAARAGVLRAGDVEESVDDTCSIRAGEVASVSVVRHLFYGIAQRLRSVRLERPGREPIVFQVRGSQLDDFLLACRTVFGDVVV